jgi:methionine-S-sulfoxide reductase
MHDPTTKDRQGNDVGTQYRSAMFCGDETQKRVAEEVKAKVDRSGWWKRPIVTEIGKAGAFTPAEAYHQEYLVKNPGGYTCHYCMIEGGPHCATSAARSTCPMAGRRLAPRLEEA